jgi:hypothetical protein
MLGRPASSYTASLLVLVQLLAGSFSQAAFATGDVDCMGSPSICAEIGKSATDQPQISADTGHGSNGAGHHCRVHVLCRSGCAHTPALGAASALTFNSAPAPITGGAPATPAFDPPLFDVLRPPN